MISALAAMLPEECYAEVKRIAGGDWREPWGARLISLPSDNCWKGRAAPGVRCVVWHICEGTFDNSVAWLRDPSSDVSANDVIARDGRIAHLVDGADSPWTNGPINRPNMDLAIVRQAVQSGVNPNRWSYTIECEGYSTRGASGALTPLQAATLIGRTAQACMAYQLTPNREHIMRHADWDSVTRANCPGYSGSEFAAWVAAVAELCRKWRGW